MRVNKYLPCMGVALMASHDTKTMKRLSRQGWHLVGMAAQSVLYRFKRGEPHAYEYCAVIGKRPSQELLTFYKESGWEPIRLALDLSDFPEAEGHAALALLKLLVRDLEDGYVSIGFGSRRGMGEIAVEGVDWDVGFPADEKLQTAWDAFVDGGGAFHLPQFPKEETKHNV